MKTRISIIFLLCVIVLTSGFGCKMTSKEVQEAMEPITLEYWRIWDGPDAFEEIIAEYNELHPFIKINYRKLRYSEYEAELLNAFAEDRGPDIFSIHNTWMTKYNPKLSPMPVTITMAYPVIKGSIKKEVVPELRTSRSLTLKELRDNFVDVVYSDVVTDGQIYGLPLSVDTLALYYNRDLLNNAGITEIPQYWNREFQQNVKKLTKQDTKRGIIQSGVALGGSDNIERFSDILSILMMQNGSIMQDENGKILFHEVPPIFKNRRYNPGLEALRFYTDFSNPAKEVYCWNDEMTNSLDMFIGGNLAFMFNYAYNLPVVKSRAPKLNFSVAKLPQIEGNSVDINLANYWVEVVSKKSANPEEAWDFVQFMTRTEQAKTYLEKTNKPTALRSLVSEQRSDDDIGIFADQILTSRSWYKGKNIEAAEEIIGNMIDNVVDHTVEIEDAITLGATKVQQTVK